MQQPRTYTVEFDKTWLSRTLDWSLRIVGQSVGGYGFIDHRAKWLPTARYATRELAERAGDIWVATGLTPAAQTDERVAALSGGFPVGVDPYGFADELAGSAEA